ncbi:MAG: L-histidine N(alpha)-methyltransferase [Candidatus Marinimicrobia bacterium]|nr:L-histidine N(alpha)-methyltransferase [Candidatus Neomarinimicrobiota bacterium]MCF7839943.1 L-histidine N(alpha)-methyltransferase [Candidatus Neomarinimicrobiota bacterium]
MTQTYRILKPGSQNPESARQQFLRDVEQGLSQTPKSIPSQYFYDETGSKLFEQIMDLPEYYLTDAEYEILERNHRRLAELVNHSAFNLVELGAGDGRKTRVLLEHLHSEKIDFKYIPIDISEGAMTSLQEEVAACCSDLEMLGVVGEYFQGLNWVEKHVGGPSLVLFLGSNIGNFRPSKAKIFLRRLRQVLRPGDFVLMGFDLKKDTRRLNAAYNDKQGITARFNLNLLARINRELAGEFDLDNWEFYGWYNPLSGAVESSLLSRKRQCVRIGACGKVFEFDAWEAIHTEYSFKYSEAEIEKMATTAGFTVAEHYHAKNQTFVDSLWSIPL